MLRLKWFYAKMMIIYDDDGGGSLNMNENNNGDIRPIIELLLCHAY